MQMTANEKLFASVETPRYREQTQCLVKQGQEISDDLRNHLSLEKYNLPQKANLESFKYLTL